LKLTIPTGLFLWKIVFSGTSIAYLPDRYRGIEHGGHGEKPAPVSPRARLYPNGNQASGCGVLRTLNVECWSALIRVKSP
jgi:hypothetical protein